jgi:acetyltransferase AlgX (SGNH hydrolase-like protein)
MLSSLNVVRMVLLLLMSAYILGWVQYVTKKRESRASRLANCALTHITLLVLLGMLELPAMCGLVDYRLVIALPEIVHVKPWNDPRNQLDRELLYTRRPGQRFVGETVGDLVHWLGIATDRRYPIDIQYDRHGFRNDHEIEQAPVVVLGDSFVEAGLVPQAALLSTRLSELLHVETANLGLGGYGPQQELIVLKRYGLELRPKVVLWFFFEGNDLLDVPRYANYSRNWDATLKELHGFKARSFTKNVLRVLGRLSTSQSQTTSEALRRSCYFRQGQDESSKTLYFAYAGMPLSREDLVSLEIAQRSFQEAKRLASEHGAQFLFVYIPIKFRVYRDFCEFPAKGYGKQWQVNNLPTMLESWCQAQDIAYLNLTESLQEHAARGDLVYFPDDGHWNAHGHEIVATTIAQFIKNQGWL